MACEPRRAASKPKSDLVMLVDSGDGGDDEGVAVTGVVMALSSTSLHAKVRKRLNRILVLSLLETQMRMRFTTGAPPFHQRCPSAARTACANRDCVSKADGSAAVPGAALVEISPLVQNSNFSVNRGSSGSTYNSSGTSLGQNPSISRLSSTAKP